MSDFGRGPIALQSDAKAEATPCPVSALLIRPQGRFLAESDVSDWVVCPTHLEGVVRNYSAGRKTSKRTAWSPRACCMTTWRHLTDRSHKAEQNTLKELSFETPSLMPANSA